MKKEKLTYCFGMECPIKDACIRHKEKINKKKELWMDGPYDKELKRCGLFIDRNINSDEDSLTSSNGHEN